MRPTLRKAVQAWFQRKMNLSMENIFKSVNLKAHWSATLDDGAKRALYFYLKDMPRLALIYFCRRYHFWYWSEAQRAWNVWNASAAVVALLRYTFWHDPGFVQEFPVEPK